MPSSDVRSAPRAVARTVTAPRARAVYERVLDRVEALDFDVLARPAALRPWELVAAAGGALLPSRAGAATRGGPAAR